MPTVTVPTPGTPISTATFGIPVADVINNLAPLRIQASAALTVGTSVADVPGTQITRVVSVPETWLCIGQWDCDPATVGWGTLVLTIADEGNVALPGQANWDDNGTGRLSVNHISTRNVTPGTRSVKLRAVKTLAGGAMVIQTISSLIVVRLPSSLALLRRPGEVGGFLDDIVSELQGG